MISKIVDGIKIYFTPLRDVDIITNIKNLVNDIYYVTNTNIYGEKDTYKSVSKIVKDNRGLYLETCILGYNGNSILNKKINMEIKFPLKYKSDKKITPIEELKKIIQLRQEI